VSCMTFRERRDTENSGPYYTRAKRKQPMQVWRIALLPFKRRSQSCTRRQVWGL